MNRTAKLIAFGMLGLVAMGAAFFAGRARAAGIPEADVLTYTGYLEDADGAPLSGDHSIAVRFWAADAGGSDLCTAEQPTVSLSSGRFQVALPAECADAVKDNPDLWVDVVVDGASLGRTKVGAVPFAVEAGHAVESDVAKRAESADDAPVVEDWQSFDPVWSVGTAANATQTGAASGRYRRVGDSVEVRVSLSLGTNGATGNLYVALPDGLTGDQAKLMANVSIGSGFVYSPGTQNFLVVPYWHNTVGKVAFGLNDLAGGKGTVAHNAPYNIIDGGALHATFTVPIQGWSSLD